MKILIFLFAACCLSVSLMGQQLPSNPDPNKCYVRSVTPDVYETEKKEFLTYSVKEAALYPHKRQRIVVKPELSQWESVLYDGCESPNPNDCQVLCYKTYPGEYKIVYRPKDESLGKPFYREITRSFLVEKGGLSSYEEIDCALTSYNVVPVNFKLGSDEFRNTGFDRRTIEERLGDLLHEHPNIRIQINAHTSSVGDADFNLELSKLRAKAIMDYLIDIGANRGRIVTRGYGETQLKNRCVDGVNCSEAEHAVNSRVEFRVLNIDN